MKQHYNIHPSYCAAALTLLMILSPLRANGQEPCQRGAGRSDMPAQIISIHTVNLSQGARPLKCEPWLMGETRALTTQSRQNVARVSAVPATSQTASDSIAVALTTLFPSLSDDTWPVSDPTIAVSREHVLAAVNSKLVAHNKSGSELFSVSLEAWFQSVLDTSFYDCGPFNPQLLYDHFSERWLLAALASDTKAASGKSYLLFAASFSDDPKGNWHAWALNLSRNGSAGGGLWANDLKLGLGANTVFVSTNQYDANGFRYAKLRLLSMPEIAAGGYLDWWDVWECKAASNRFAFSIVPAICFDPVNTVFGVETNPDIDSLITLWEITPNTVAGPHVFPNPPKKIPAYTPPDPAPQRNTRDSLNTGDARVRSVILRNDSLWASFTTGGADFTSIGSQVRVVGFFIKSGAKIFDEAHVVNDDSHFMPSLAVNRSGNLALVHYSSSDSSLPGLEALVLKPRAAQKADKGRLIIKQSGSHFPAQQNRIALWGRHTGVVSDPFESKVFWGIGEVVDVSAPQKWRTWIGAISLCDCKPDLEGEGDSSQLAIERNVSQTALLRVKNNGDAHAHKTHLGAYFSADTEWSPHVDTRIAGIAVTALNPGESQDVVLPYKIGSNISSQEGFLLFVADDQSVLSEPDESNNVLARPVVIVEALSCSLAFRRPAAGALLCAGNHIAEVIVNIEGGRKPYTILACKINDSLATFCSDSLFSREVALAEGQTQLRASLVVRDVLGLIATCETSMTVTVASPLRIQSEIISPQPNAAVCGKDIQVKGKATVFGGIPPYTDSCWVNGKLVSTNDDTFMVSYALPTDNSTLTLICKVTDGCGSVTADTTIVPVKADTTGPVVKWWYSPFYPFVKGKISDPETGIQSVIATVLINATFTHEAFAPGEKEVDFQIDPITSSRPIGFLLKVRNQAGCEVVVDPIVIQLKMNTQISMSIPAMDHFLNIENHGLEQITLNAAGYEYKFIAHDNRRGGEGTTFYVPFEGGFTINLRELWQEANLDVTLTGAGQAEQYAYVIFADKPWDFTTALERGQEPARLPERFALLPCYPNPFNPVTHFRFEIPAGKPRPARLEIYNLHGQLVTTLLEGYVSPGYYELAWHGLDQYGQPVSSGIYFYSLRVDDFHAARKMTLAK